MLKLLYIGFGGFLGSILRYVSSKYLNQLMSGFPLGTLVVNVSGSFVLGFLLYSVSFGKNISSDTRDFIAIGFIGAFTTMSTFAYESFRLLELNEWMFFALNLFFNIILCLLAVYAGKELSLMLFK